MAESTNIDRVVRFDLDGILLKRRLVWDPQDVAQDLNPESAVGRVLLTARTGDTVTVAAPGGSVTVRLLEVQ